MGKILIVPIREKAVWGQALGAELRDPWQMAMKVTMVVPGLTPLVKDTWGPARVAALAANSHTMAVGVGTSTTICV